VTGLEDLQAHWEGAYHICMVDEWWAAVRLDDLDVLLSETGAGLRQKIRADYARRPVRRKDGWHETS
jgi:hypothetical protein